MWAPSNVAHHIYIIDIFMLQMYRMLRSCCDVFIGCCVLCASSSASSTSVYSSPFSPLAVFLAVFKSWGQAREIAEPLLPVNYSSLTCLLCISLSFQGFYYIQLWHQQSECRVYCKPEPVQDSKELQHHQSHLLKTPIYLQATLTK